MVVLRREKTGPRGRRHLRIDWGRVARLGTPVLFVSALLFGAAVSATVLVGFWDKEVGRKRAAEAKLAASVDRTKTLAEANRSLERRLAASRATSARFARNSARLAQSAERLEAAARRLVRENAALTASAGRLHGQGGSLGRRAASVSKLAATLGNDLVSVLAYITNTSAGSLDPSYLKAQLDYLRPAVADVRSAAEALGTGADSYANAVDGFPAQAKAYY